MRKALRQARAAEASAVAPQTTPQDPSAQVSSPARPLSETVKMAAPVSGSTVPDQAAQTMPVPKPPSIPSHERQAIMSTVASQPPKISSQPSKSDNSDNNVAIISAGVVVLGSALAIVLIASIALFIWRPWAKNTNLSNSSNSPASGPGTPRSVADRIGLDMVWIKPGAFQMGNMSNQPIHWVEFKQGFYLEKYEITQSQWQSVMGSNPSNFKACGGNCPVEMVTWDDVQDFIKRLNDQNGKFVYRLPSEAEWEFACRAGTSEDYYGPVSDIGWYGSNSSGTTHPVGLKQPNSYGLYDMSGNVWELTADLIHFNYNDAPSDGRPWVFQTTAKSHVIRGGSYFNTPDYLTSARRGWRDPEKLDFAGDHVGFRLAATSRR
jgi:formylglycine-generating enzyme required for sulfatase activity